MFKLKKFAGSPPEIKRNILRRVMQMVVTFIVIALLLFIPAGTMKWLYAWLYMALYLLTLLVGALALPPDLLAERGSKKKNAEQWDKQLSRLLLLAMVAYLVVSGLDFRWKWSPLFSPGWHLAAMAFFLLGCGLNLWAMLNNHFFSTAVRLQTDRGHEVCSSGPYKFVRHPGYASMILYNLVTPIIFGSLWALIPAFLMAVLFVIRTWMEDKTLKTKLAGYTEYMSQTRYLVTHYKMLIWILPFSH
jgi:protein-S-isoprenylcysteine O-methyltransferase Ste14